jgi:hypothetical protein
MAIEATLNSGSAIRSCRPRALFLFQPEAAQPAGGAQAPTANREE